MAGASAPEGRVHKRKSISDQQKRRVQALSRQNESRNIAQFRARCLAKVLLAPSSLDEHELSSTASVLPHDESLLQQPLRIDEPDLGENAVPDDESESRDSKDYETSGIRDPSSLRGSKAREWFSKQLMMPEWMVDVPPRLKQDWYVLPRPAGRRCLIISVNGSTLSRTRDGRILHRFPSALPNGSRNKGRNSDSTFSILDCIFHEPDQTYYVIDMLCWKGYSLHDCTSEFRFFWLNSRLDETGASDPPSTYHRYTFRTVPIYECDHAGLQSAYAGVVPYVKDGLLFSNRQAQYEPGLTPLCLLWKDPHSSQYFIDTDKEGAIPMHQQVVLELQEDGTVGTLDDPPVVLAKLSQEFIEQNQKNCKPGSLLRFALNEQCLQIIDGKPSAADLHFQGFVPRTRAFADSCSKILFQYAARHSPLTFEELFASLQWSNEESDTMET